MKRFTALFLAICLVMLLLLTGCQGNSSSSSHSNENDKTQNGSTVGNENVDSTQGNDTEGENDESDQSGTVKYMTYDDLPIDQYFFHWDTDDRVFYNYPLMREDSRLGGYRYTLGYDYNLFAATQDDEIPPYTGPVEGMFEELMPLFLLPLSDEEGEYFRDGDLMECLDVTTSIVTLDNGIQAVKFEGMLDSLWRENTDYAVYGYLFVYGEFNLAFGYSIHVEDGSIDPEIDVEQLRDYVDRMVLTVRSEE